MPRLGQTTNVLDRINAKTVYEGECWRFTGKKTGKGYGNIWYQGKMVRISRLILHLFENADLNDDSWVACHTDNCKFHDCWNPIHLKVGTQQDNVNDQIRLGRFHYGTENLRSFKKGS